VPKQWQRTFRNAKGLTGAALGLTLSVVPKGNSFVHANCLVRMKPDDIDGFIASVHATLVLIEPVKNLLYHQIVWGHVSRFKHHMTFVFGRRAQGEKQLFL
jgi:hypothetical protein